MLNGCFVLQYCVLLSFAIISLMKRELVVSPSLSSECDVAFNVIWLFLAVPWVGL